uniref:Male accessory gland serine protease inhibitor n=1 Tax=Drosophila funebris TaxID=7221 RepID=IMAP_DROFU|nr:RecName: Full=Male accessory gland serine protease inhibitor; AltName: Full=Acrosin inhibitor; AltName: Full=Paragonial peptide D [Drosophila funebris]
FKNPECGEPHSLDGSPNGISCRGYFPSWSYNPDAQQCVSFVYGGCGGNNNRFGSQNECEERCI